MKKLFFNLLIASLLGIFSMQCFAESSIIFASPSIKIAFPKPNSIIQFFSTISPDETSSPGVAIYIQVPDKGNEYYSLYVGTISSSSTDTGVEIVAIFLNDIGGFPGDELFVIAATQVSHGGNTEGREYFTYVFENPGDKRVNSGLTQLVALQKQIGGGFEGKIEGKRHRAPYTDVAGVRNILRKLGLIK
jgi:hypothetical protein